MHTVSIRRAVAADLPALLALMAQPDMDGDRVLSLPEAQAIFARVSNHPHQEIYVALVEAEVVGTFSLVIVNHLSHHGARSLIIEDVVVKASRQGEGIGRQMMEFAVARGKQLKCYKIMLSSGIKRERAHAFYEHLGFQKHGFSFLLPLER